LFAYNSATKKAFDLLDVASNGTLPYVGYLSYRPLVFGLKIAESDYVN